MRLFYAILLDDACKDRLEALQAFLRAQGAKASFARRQLLHLTLVFLGEVHDAARAIACLEALQAAAFTLELAGVGRFAGREGDTLWAAVRESPPLMALPAELEKQLRAAGFKLENRAYRPHITLARRARFARQGGFAAWQAAAEAALPRSTMPVGWVSLMASSREDGQLVYTELAARRLNGVPSP